MRKTDKMKFVFFLMITLTALSCDNPDRGLYFLFKNNTDLLVKKYTVYEKTKGEVYVHIERQSDYNKIINQPLQSVYIRKMDTIVQGKAIKSSFSREIDLKPFIFIINNFTGCLDTYDIEGKKVFFIGLKEDLLPLYEKSIITPKSWETK